MTGERTVVITGVGVLSPIGTGREEFWTGLFEGRTGFKEISLFDSSNCRVHVGGEIDDFDPLLYIPKRGLRDLDRSTRLLCSAARLAVDDAALEITDDTTRSIGVSIGATFGSLRSIAEFDRVGLIEGPRYVNPSHFPNTVINSPASHMSIYLGIKGFSTTISTGFCAGLDAISYAADFIRMGRAEAVLAGGVEELCEETLFYFDTLGYLSGSDGSDPLCCPFDNRRNGMIFSEGAVVLVLEEEQHAISRGAKILAEIKGYANAFDPEPGEKFMLSGKGLRTAVTLAMDDAGLDDGDIDHLSAGANSTRGLDAMETSVIKEIFGKSYSDIPVSSIKSMTGETYSASGALAVVAATGAIRMGKIPPTVNYLEKDPHCDLDYVPNRAREAKLNNVMVTTSDPLGLNTALVVGGYQGE